jgi:NADH-quinone oxidoreductase subunit H
MYNFFDQLLVNIGQMTGRMAGPVAVMVLVAAAIVAVFALLFGLATWLERKVLARIQNRLGPNRVGPAGLLQFVADGIKMLIKEDIVPAGADRLVHFLAPVVIVLPALLMFAFLPFGRNMAPINIDTAVIAFFAVGAASELAVFMGGWASRNKYSMLGAMRAVAQMVSYEIPLVLAAVPVVMVVGSLSTTAIVQAQSTGGFWGISGWFVWTPWGLAGFILFLIASTAESNRSPFDMPEAESEIIAGFHTEYSGFKFALFFLAEYLAMMAMAGLSVTLFLGGWNGPRLLPSWAWFFLKGFALIFTLIWFRGTFPRVRVDQLMGFAWKVMLPFALLNIFAAALWYSLPRGSFNESLWAWVLTALVIVGAYFGITHFTASRAIERREYRYGS